MSGRLFLVLDLNGEKTFEADQVRQSLRGLDGIYGWRDDIADYQFGAEFEYDGDRTIITLAKDCKYMSIKGVGAASTQLAFEIQRHYGNAILAFDGEFSLSAPLNEVQSAGELRLRLHLD